MSFSPKHLVSNQIPSHIAEENPLFVKFLEYYYEFQEASNIQKTIQDILSYEDADTVDIDFLKGFFEEYRKIPKTTAADPRLVAKHIYDLYKAKGSEQALKLLFRILYNNDIRVRYPNEKILRASDGRWKQESFITVSLVTGVIPTALVPFLATNSRGNFSIMPTRYETISPNTLRVYFESKTYLSLDDSQSLTVLNGGGAVTGVFKLEKSPDKLVINQPGQAWQVGAIFTLPGSLKNTIARVTRITANKGILEAEVIDHGYVHDPNQNYLVSPYPNKPSGSSITIVSEITSYDPYTSQAIYHHTIDISDYTEGVAETVSGVFADAGSPNTYFASDYVDSSYSGYEAFVNSTTPIFIPPVVESADLTMQQWLDSRATVAFSFSNIVKTHGRFVDERGMLSNQEICLQDNYFYQMFSYVIETDQTLDSSDAVMSLVHPAGYKYFIETSKEFVADVSAIYAIERALSVDSIWVSDIQPVYDQKFVEFIKSITETISVLEQSTLNIGKTLSDIVTGADGTPITSITGYATDYFAENYSALEYAINIS